VGAEPSEERAGGVVEGAGDAGSQVHQAGEWHVDLLDLAHRQVLVDALELVEVLLVDRHGLVRPQRGPLVPLEAALAPTLGTRPLLLGHDRST
jgi:hypothetical protein